MRPLRIEFVQRRHWLVIWLAACVALAAVGGVLLQKATRIQAESRSLLDRATLLEREAGALARRSSGHGGRQGTPSAAEKENARAAQLLDTVHWAKALATIESVQQAGARLLHVQADAGGPTITITFELQELHQVPALTAQLNAGPSPAAWRLREVARVAPGGSAQGTKAHRASWSSILRSQP